MSNRYPIAIENRLFVFDDTGAPVDLSANVRPDVAFTLAHQTLAKSDNPEDGTKPQLTLQFTGEYAIKEFITLMNGYLNTRWEEVPRVWRNIMDGIEHGSLIDHHVRHEDTPFTIPGTGKSTDEGSRG